MPARGGNRGALHATGTISTSRDAKSGEGAFGRSFLSAFPRSRHERRRCRRSSSCRRAISPTTPRMTPRPERVPRGTPTSPRWSALQGHLLRTATRSFPGPVSPDNPTITRYPRSVNRGAVRTRHELCKGPRASGRPSPEPATIPLFPRGNSGAPGGTIADWLPQAALARPTGRDPAAPEPEIVPPPRKRRSSG